MFGYARGRAGWAVSAALLWTVTAQPARAAGVAATADALGTDDHVATTGANAPTVTLSQFPPALTNQTSATFAWTTADPDDASGFAFSCALDGAPFAPCGPGAAFAGLDNGIHNFAVHATDPAGNVGNDVVYVWRVDLVPPVLDLPADVVVNASSPSGAEVEYVAAASDSDGNAEALVFQCAPVPGRFPVGTTTVSCSARDPAGNVAKGSFTVRVKGAAEQLTALGETVNANLGAKIEAAKALLETSQVPAACRVLQDLPSKATSTEQSSALSAEATRIAAAMGCP